MYYDWLQNCLSTYMFFLHVNDLRNMKIDLKILGNYRKCFTCFNLHIIFINYYQPSIENKRYSKLRRFSSNF